MADTAHPKRRTRQKVLIVGGAVVLLLLVLVALLPTLITWGLGHGIIRNAINKNLNGEATFASLRTSWFGDQAIRDLRIVDAQGKEAANLSVDVRAGLWQIITQRPGRLDVTISGTINGEVREDGSLSFQDLLAKSTSTSTSPPSSPTTEPFRLPSNIPPLDIQLANVDVTIKNRQTDQSLALNDLTGEVSYKQPGEPIITKLQGATLTDGVPGSLQVSATLDQLFAADGTMTLRGANANVRAELKSIPYPFSIPGVTSPTTVDSAIVELKSDDLTDRIIATMDVRAQIQGQPPSHLMAEAALGSVLTTRGELSLRGATANISMQAQNLPIQTSDLRGMLQHFKSTVVSNDLTQTIVIAIDSTAQLEGHESTVLSANLSADQLLAPNGDVTLALERVTGTVQGTTIPTAPLQPFLNATPIVASRDLGPVVDVNASFSPGEEKEISLTVSAPFARLELRAMANPTGGAEQAIRGNHLLLTSQAAHPDLVKGYTSLTVDRRIPVTIQLTSFSLPAKDAVTGSRPMTKYSAAGSLNVPGEMTLLLAQAEGEPLPVRVQNVQASFETPALEQQLELAGSAMIDGAPTQFQFRLTELFNDRGELNPIGATPVGRMTITNLPATTLARFAPNHGTLMNEVIGSSVSVIVSTRLVESNLVATTEIRGAEPANVNAKLALMRMPTALRVAAGDIAMTVTPSLASMLQQDSKNPIALSSPMSVAIEVQPFELPADASKGGFAYTMPDTPLAATIRSPGGTMQNVPGLKAPVALQDVLANVAFTPRENGWQANVDGNMHISSDAKQLVAAAAYRADIAKSGEQTSINASVHATQVSIARVEQLLGREPGELSQWTGDATSGDQREIMLNVTGENGAYRGSIQPNLTNFAAQFDFNVDEQAIALTGRTTRFVLDRQALERRMNAPTRDGRTASSAASANDATVVRVPKDVPLTLTVTNLRMPSAALAGEPFDPLQFSLDASATGQAFEMQSLSPQVHVQTTLSDLELRVQAKDIRQGISLSMNSRANAVVTEQQPAQAQPSGAAGARPPGVVGAPAANQPAAPAPPPANADGARNGTLQVNGVLRDLAIPAPGDASRVILQPANANLQLTARAEDVPTAIADAVANMQGLLVAAVGSMMRATVTAEDFSLNSGQIDVRLETENGWLETRVVGQNNSLSILDAADNGKPLKAELALTASLRDRLLSRIHPFLADVRTTEQPLRATISAATVPFTPDGKFNLAGLNADLQITVGAVELDGGSSLLGLMRFAGQGDRLRTIPGYIEPIVARVRNGIISYDKFSVKIDKYTMVYSGEIDLVNSTLNLRTELPLAALAHTFQELEGVADRITVPIVTRGKIGEARPRANFDDVLKQGAREGLGRLLEDALRGGGGGRKNRSK